MEVGQDELDEYDTIGGYIQGTLVHIPKVGDNVTLDNYRSQVEQMDGLRVDRVSFTPIEMKK